MWRFLQIQYSLTETGRVVRKINKKRLTTMRRRMKKLAGVLSERDFFNLYNSWINGYSQYMSKRQRQNMDELYEDLKKEKYERSKQC